MKNLVRFVILIHLYSFAMGVIQTSAQSWPCSVDATTNINIPNNNQNVYLSEPSVAVHPLYGNIVLVACNHSWEPPTGGVTAHTSEDWGVTWSPSGNGIFQNSYSDPSACIDLNGYMYVSYLTSGTITIQRSLNAGASWTPYIITGGGFLDKPHLQVDVGCISPRKGRLYCAFTGSNYYIKSCYSTNNGVNWSTPIEISSNVSSIGVNLTIDNAGNVFAVWPKTISGNYNKVMFNKSINGGESWVGSIDITLQHPTQTSIGYPVIATNLVSDYLFIAYSGFDQFNNIYLLKSTDGGDTWSESIIKSQGTNPWITSDPATGYLTCIYYSAGYASISISTNSGSSWCDMKVSTSATGGGQQAHNDYIGVAFNKGVIYPVWADKRNDNTYNRVYTYPYYVIEKDLIIQNKVFDGQQIEQSANTITAYNDVIINSNANVVFRSVHRVTLEPGFYTNDNSTFIADLYHCQGFSMPQIRAPEEFISDKISIDHAYEYSLSQNYPNPFNPLTTINYVLKENAWVTLIIYNLLGQEVRRLVEEYRNAGFNSVIWDGANSYGNQVSTGIYFCKLTANEFTGQKKMVIIR